MLKMIGLASVASEVILRPPEAVVLRLKATYVRAWQMMRLVEDKLRTGHTRSSIVYTS